MSDFRHSNIWYWRLARTVVEVVLGFAVANVANILSGYGLDAMSVSIIGGAVTAACSPIIADLREADNG